MEKHLDSDLRVFVIWFAMLPGDSRSDWEQASRIIPDPRVIHFWDEDRVVGSWFAERAGQAGYVIWDTYYLYGPEARWGSLPEPLASTGQTVYAQRRELEASLLSLLDE